MLVMHGAIYAFDSFSKTVRLQIIRIFGRRFTSFLVKSYSNKHFEKKEG